eukprot:Sdes_comp11877_c0_seq2m2891
MNGKSKRPNSTIAVSQYSFTPDSSSKSLTARFTEYNKMKKRSNLLGEKSAGEKRRNVFISAHSENTKEKRIQGVMSKRLGVNSKTPHNFTGKKGLYQKERVGLVRGAKKPRKNAAKPAKISAEKLDQQIDEYMMKDANIAKKRLDEELEAMMKTKPMQE